jgi:hypothetical protein
VADTAQALITDALKDLGYLAVGESPSAEDLVDGLQILNDWAAAKGTQRLMQWATKEENFPLQAGLGTYTMGPSGVFNTVRPTAILQAYIRDSNGNDWPVIPIPRERYEEEILKTYRDPFPQWLWYDPQFPLGLLKFLGVPSAAYTIYLHSPLQPGTFAALSTAFSFPPEYRRMYRKNLALELAPTFSVEPSRLLFAHAAESTADVKRNNLKPLPMKNDAAGVVGSRGRPAYNIYRGQ